jgi:ABC-type multidrug transport system fused ATPase/permease subunit
MVETERNIKRRDVERVLHHLGRLRGLYGLSLFLLCVISASQAVKVIMIRPAIDTLTRDEVTRQDLNALVLILAAAFFGGYVANYFYSVTNKVIAGRVTMNIRRQIFDHLLGQPLGFFSKHHSTDLASRVVNDIGQFEFSTITMLQMLVRDALQTVFFLGWMFYVSWSVALICLAVGGLIALALAYHNRHIVPLAQRTQKQLSGVASHVTELIGGMELVVSFGMGRSWIERFRKINEKHFDASYDLEKTRAKAVLVSHSLAGAAVIAIVFFTGLNVVSGTITAGEAGSIIGAMYLVQMPLTSAPNQVTHIVRGLGAAGRVFEILDVEPEVQDPPQPAPFPTRLDIEFSGVSFAYDPKKPVLQDISFRLAEGEALAVVGDSGAGKSTVARLLLRFYDPTAGQVLLGGVPVKLLEREKLYEALSYVPQDSFLFNGTLRENLTIGRPEASEAEIADVIRRACLQGYVERLPHGLDTRVGERGLTLSGGERQRVAIARALLRHPRVMVLDEATSAMDVELEAEILRELVGVPGMTVVAITHRPRMAELADRVLRLAKGRVQEGDRPRVEV